MSEYKDDDYTKHIHPSDWPLGDDHHSDAMLTRADCRLADKLAWYMGDLFIDPNEAPVTQWSKVARALRIHGLQIVDAEESEDASQK